MKLQWTRRARAAKRSFEIGRVESLEECQRRETAERIATTTKRVGVWWPPSHESEFWPWRNE